MKHEKIIAIIPARGGSKSIPRKNIKSLKGKPLIAYPIELAKSVKEIDKIIVTTDDDEIAQLAKNLGAEVPFIRPKELAEDETPTLPVLQHCVKWLENSEGYKPDLIILLYPTNPFLKVRHITSAIRIMQQKECNSVISVTKDLGHYWYFDETQGKYLILYPKKRVNRQYYRHLYKENGAIYFSNYDTIIKKNKIVDEDNVEFIVMEKNELVDIDTLEDWATAENKF